MSKQIKLISKKVLNLIIEKTGFDLYGFKLYASKDNMYYFTRNVNERTDIISFSSCMSSYDKEKLVVIWYTAKVVFNEINLLFDKAKISEIDMWWNYDYLSTGSYVTCISHPDLNPKKNTQVFVPQIKPYNADKSINHEGLDKLCTVLRTDLEDVFLPFFDLFPTLQSVNDDIVEKYSSWMELREFIPGNFGVKKMAIMAICGNPHYLDYIQEYESIIRDNINVDRERNLLFLEFFLRLKNVIADRYNV